MIKVLLMVFSCSVFSFSNYNCLVFSGDCHEHPGSAYVSNDDVDEANGHSRSISSNDMIDYFRNLYSYSPENSHGSCGYVSFIQYLSFYDCFYNDSIIPERYERNQGSVSTFYDARAISPGVLRQTYPSGSSALYNFVINNKESDYQMYLMYLVNEYYGRDSTNYSCGVGMWDYHIIMDVISAFNSTSYNYVNMSNFWPSTIPTDPAIVAYFDACVKSELDNGNPVMLHIGRYNSNTGLIDDYHSVVAYYYDNYGIHANFGWGPNDTDLVIDSTYQITDFGKIDISNVSETHSANFIINNTRYCGCGLVHSHSYTHYYTQYLIDKHKCFCSCGEYTLQKHVINSNSTFMYNGHTYANCIRCMALVNLDLTPVIVINYSNGTLFIENDDDLDSNEIIGDS